MHAFHSFTKDTEKDGHHAAMQLRYQAHNVDGSGKWSGWRYAWVASAHGKGNKVERYGNGRYVMRDVHFRACVKEHNNVVRCDKVWH